MLKQSDNISDDFDEAFERACKHIPSFMNSKTNQANAVAREFSPAEVATLLQRCRDAR